MKSIRSLLLLATVLFIACLGIWMYTSSVLEKSRISEEQEIAAEEFEVSEDDQTYMSITNRPVLYKEMPAIATSVINQTYVKNYEKDGVIDRYATIEGDVNRTGSTYDFVIHFLESGIRRKVTITVQNVATDNYDIEVGDKL